MRNRVREFRLKRGWTLEQLAEKSGVSTSQLSKIENGKRGWSMNSLERLAKALNVGTGELLDVSNAWQDAPVFGVVADGAVVQPSDHRKRPKVVIASHLRAPAAFGPLIVVIVKNNSLYPRYIKQSAIFCTRDAVEPQTCVGKECLVQLEDGMSLLRTVHAGSRGNLFNLLSHKDAPDIDVALIACRPIIYIAQPSTYQPSGR